MEPNWLPRRPVSNRARAHNAFRVRWSIEGKGQGFRVYLRPFRDKATSLVGLSYKHVADACCRTWQLAPAQSKPVAPALYDPADLDHVQGTWPGTTIEAELQRLLTPVQHHAATRAFLLKDLDVVDGYIYGRRWKTRLLPVGPPIWASAPEAHISQGTLACSWIGNVYFGHWVSDDLTLYLAAAELGNPFTLERTPYLHEPQYRELLHIANPALRRAHLDEMIVLEDIGQNDYKRRRYELLRSRLRAHVRKLGSEYVYIRRGTSGEPRDIVNSPEVESFLGSKGFAVIDPEALRPIDIAAQLLDARVVISVEGSQLAHALLSMAQGGIMCCIQPPWRFNNIHRGQAECLSMRYASIVGRPCEGGFRVDIDGLKRLLDKMDEALASLPNGPPTARSDLS